MSDADKIKGRLLDSLQERAKELNCLYEVEEVLSNVNITLDDAFGGVIQAIPQGLQYPDSCQPRIEFEDTIYQPQNFAETRWVLSSSIVVQDKVVGSLKVYYTKELPASDVGPFLKEEAKLINTIADRLGHFVMYHRMKQLYHSLKKTGSEKDEENSQSWQVALNLLRQTDRNLFLNISHKMLNYLCWSGVEEAKRLQQYYNPDQRSEEDQVFADTNRPYQKRTLSFSSDFLSDETFKIAADHLSDNEIFTVIQKWIHEDRMSFLLETLNRNTSLAEVAEALRKYYRMSPGGVDLPTLSQRGARVSLVRRFFSDQLDYINIAKNHIEIVDFYHLMQNVIYGPESHGKLGGKAAGMFLAYQILKKAEVASGLLNNLKAPKTWYITSDVILYFMNYNNLQDVAEQKYKDINQVRIEYPHVIQSFKNAHFPPDIIQGLSVALDDFKDSPLIVRSSSLLEDRMGAAFSGKYKSLFLANQGPKEKRLEALTDAIAEVYASVFGPDPIEYRAERGLLDFHEEMGIMIQEVVGVKIGQYFMPAFAGVAFSRNEFRWSPRIKREDGLIRFVPGLGTRAVDRLSDDYPILVAPGQPGLRVNITCDEIIRYSPKKIDVIDLKDNSFETVEIKRFLKECGPLIPRVNQMISICDRDHIHQQVGPNIDFESDELVVTFEGLISRTPFVGQINTMLKLLEGKLNFPVDIEFASDGHDFYLLQCRPQSSADNAAAVPIPKDVSPERVIFSAKRFVSNGRVPDITHIVYVDPGHYGELPDRADLLAVGRAVSRLNQLLPKRQFILMGPGRWGSRGDIKLGVNVTYSDINNTAMLIEVARQKGNYLPDLSFGTHFFQDLVESHIRYLPLYPDDPGVIFNERFLTGSPSLLPEILPEFEYLSDTLKLIDIPRITNGMVLQVLMNADLDEAIGLLVPPKSVLDSGETKAAVSDSGTSEAWRWRMRMASYIASLIDPEKFGVKGFYVFGSTKNATAGPASDIDILIHFQGPDEKRCRLEYWLNGWSLCLDEMNYQRTGYRTGGLLDVHIITDDDIARKTSYAAKIGAITDAARALPIPNRKKNGD